MATGGRRKSSILTDRKLSVDFARKLSAISVASDISLISDRFGLDQGELKTIVQDILEMNINDDFDVSLNIIINWPDLSGILQLGSEDGMSEYGDSEEAGVSLWQELQNETIRLDSRKSSSSSQVTVTNFLSENQPVNVARPARTLWTLLRTSSRLRSISERSVRCWRCTSTRGRCPALPWLHPNSEPRHDLIYSIYL